jgi:hypothetical protein
MRRMLGRSFRLAATAALLFGATGALAGNDSCREWQEEHCEWKARAIHRYLRSAPQRELDEAMFEILQREAYLTSCEVSARASRDVLVGWRLVGRTPDEFGSAVLEAVLERSGFDVALRSRLSGVIGEPAHSPAPIANTAMQTSSFGRGAAGAAR